MAFYTDTRVREAGLLARIFASLSAATARMTENMIRRRIARTTFAELAALSDRDLADLGMSRADIRYVARQAARDAL